MRSQQKTLKNWNIWEIKDKELLNLIVGREGGKTTTLIIDEILKKPYNKNQLANKLHLDYNTISHHIKIIHRHKYVTKEEFDRVIYYHPTEKLFKSLEEYNLLKEYLFK